MYNKVIRWTARILMILSLLFMMMFSLDVFEMGGSFGDKMLGLLIHNIPALILAAILILAWKNEMAGGILLILAALCLMIKFHSFTVNKGSLVIFMPILVAGILFIVSYLTGHRKK